MPRVCLSLRVRPFQWGKAGRQHGQAIVELAVVLPFCLLVILAVGDFGRFYTDAIAVESGAREAADYGAFDSSNWTTGNTAITVAEMERRACTAMSHLPAYQEPAATVGHATCTNPTFSYELKMPPGVTDCSDPTNAVPCTVHVRLTYAFRLFLATPLLPQTLALDRDVSFQISDFPSS